MQRKDSGGGCSSTGRDRSSDADWRSNEENSRKMRWKRAKDRRSLGVCRQKG